MDTTVFAVVMAAAALHAGWNALLKIGLDRYLTASLIQIGAGCVAVLALPFFELPRNTQPAYVTGGSVRNRTCSVSG